MPIPKPKPSEKKSRFISRCIKTMSHRDSDKHADVIKAMCYDKWRKPGK